MAVTAVLDRSTSARATGRFDRSSRTVLWCAATFLTVLVALEAYRFTLPTDGWGLMPPVEAPVFSEDLLGLETPLEAGDQLIAVDGVPFPLLLFEAASLRRPELDYAAGEVKTYTVLRGGTEVDLEVPVGRWTAAGVARALGRTLLDTPVGGVYRWLAWLLAAFVFSRRPDYLSVRLFFLLESVMLGLAITSSVAQVTVPEVLSPALFYAARFSGDLFAWLLVPPLGLHLILAFPGTRPVPRLALWSNYGTPWLVLGAVWVWGAVVLVPIMAGAYSVLSLAAVARLVYQHGSGAQGARVRWFAFAFGASSLISALFWLEQVGLLPHLSLFHSLVLEHCLCDLVYVAGFAIAILWHDLFDIDVIIGRTLVYGGLTIMIIGVYAALVGGVGRLLAVESSLPLTVVATVAVALGFDPLRWRLQRASNRLLYGFRDEPYEVLSRLGERLRSTPQLGAALGDATRAVAEALRLPFAAVTLGSSTAASYGEPREGRESFPLSHAGHVFGELIVSPRQGDGHLSKADRRLLDTLSTQVGTVAHSLLLEADLERARLYSLEAREEERRRLGSDLHDDVGHRLTWLLRQSQDCAALVDSDPEAAKATLAALSEEAKSTIARVRSLAHRLHPPELAVLGLAGAIEERLQALDGGARLRFHLDAAGLGDGLGQLPASVELAAYYIVQEALSNVVKHAGASSCWVRLAVVESAGDAYVAVLADRYLELEVRDDGASSPAWGTDAPPTGLGLVSMRGRAREVGGSLGIERPPGGGTWLRATLPWPT